MHRCLPATAGLLLAATACAALADAPQPVLDMNADGEVQIAVDGHVSDYRLNSDLAPQVASLVDRAVRGWRFQPIVVDGQAVAAKTAMHLKLRAESQGGGDQYRIRIVAARFGDARREPGMRPPRYPEEAVSHRVGARVLIAVRLDDTGKVVEAEPYQTSLDVRTRSENQAEHFRKLFEQASLRAARSWQYDLSESIDGHRVGTVALVPVVFNLVGFGVQPVRDGRWKVYLPGPVHAVPWVDEHKVADAVDANSDQAQALGSRFRLKDDVVGRYL